MKKLKKLKEEPKDERIKDETEEDKIKVETKDEKVKEVFTTLSYSGGCLSHLLFRLTGQKKGFLCVNR